MLTFEFVHCEFFERARSKFFKLFSAIKTRSVSSGCKSRMKRSTVVLVALLLGYFISNGQETLSQQKPERIFQSGQDLLAHQQYGAAYEAFTDFLKLNQPSHYRYADAQYYQAFCALNLYHADGEKRLEDFIAANPTYPKSITAYYDLANFFYTEKNYSKASAYFAKVDFPTLSTAQQNTGRFRWGYSLFSQRNLKASLDQFNAIKAAGGQYGPAASYYAGFIESQAGDYENALIDLKRAEANSSYATVVPVLIANVYYQQKNDNELIAYAEAALKRESVASPDEISLLLAETYFRKGDYKKSLAGYESYFDNHEKNIDRGVLHRAGVAAYSTSKDDLAVEYLKGAASDADSIGVYSSYVLGLAYLRRQEKPLALTAFNAVKKSRKDPSLKEESTFQSAKISYELGQPDAAIDEFEMLLKDFPNSQHARETKELLSQAYVNANNFNKAIEYIEALPKRTPAIDRAFQKATYLKGTELFNKEEYAEAVAFFEKSLQYPVDAEYVAEASYWCAETYSVGRKYEQAIPLYERALGSSPKPDLIRSIRYGLGYAQYNLQRYDAALQNFREYSLKATAADANYADGILRLADSYYATKGYPEALTSYNKVVQLNSVDADYAHLQRGIILAILKRYAEAGSEFERVSKGGVSRYADDAVFQHAQMDFEQSNYTAAVANYTTVINASKSSRLLPYAYSKRAASYYNLKKYGQTANDYITVLEQYPAHPVAQDLLVPLQESLTLANRSGEFDKYLTQFKQANPDAKGIEAVEFETAKSLYFSQNYQKAIDNLSRYVASYPESAKIPEAKYYEGESYYRLKDFARALDVFKQIAGDNSFEMVNKAIARVGELEFKQGHYENAVPAFQKLSAQASNKKEESTAWNGLMESYYLLAKYDSSDVFAKKILEQGSVNASSQNKAALFMGKNAMGRGDYETAKDEFLTTLNSARDENGAEAKYLLGEIFYLNKEYKQCYETLLSLNSDFASYEDWVGKSYLLLADNFLATGDVFQAKGTLKSLIDNFPAQGVKDLARQKLRAIEEAELKKKAQEKADTTGNN